MIFGWFSVVFLIGYGYAVIYVPDLYCDDIDLVLIFCEALWNGLCSGLGFGKKVVL